MENALNRAELLEHLLPVTRAAGDVIMSIYATDFEVRGKSDESPVTEADEKPRLPSCLPCAN
jgi:3'(2'), 5'-bisphosphate nucleotidase